jgi:hypothetical protein
MLRKVNRKVNSFPQRVDFLQLFFAKDGQLLGLNIVNIGQPSRRIHLSACHKAAPTQELSIRLSSWILLRQNALATTDALQA